MILIIVFIIFKAAKLNHTDAQYHLGIFFFFFDIPNFYSVSINYLQKAADSNLRQAQYKLGMIYFEV